ncbi:MAG: imidazole glycerol phosphate synthase subunit HisH [Phycisphaerales bacterium]|nr:imidazole glycerol phosphate synthase subunit HisH [Phycisphaerales bacterium]
MPPAQVYIVRTGIANIASVLAAIRRAGGEPVMTADRTVIDQATALVLPGVGAFSPGMRAIDELGIADVLKARFAAARPTLCICLGMQLLFESSQEAPGIRGLGIVPGTISKFTGNIRIPQLGWNQVQPDPACSLLKPGFAYYANSYRAAQAPAGWASASSTHGEPLIAAIERGPMLACQFHPELSGPWGAQLISRWLTSAGIPAQRAEAIPC